MWKSQGKRIMADWSTRTSSQRMMRQTRPIIPASFLHHFCAHCIYIIHILDLDRFGLQTEASNLRPSVPWSWQNTDEELRRWKRRQDSRHPDISNHLKTHRTHMVLTMVLVSAQYWEVLRCTEWSKMGGSSLWLDLAYCPPFEVKVPPALKTAKSIRNHVKSSCSTASFAGRLGQDS